MNADLKHTLMARACSPELAADICAKLDRLADAEAGELKNALAVGQACIELFEERKDNERLRARIAELEKPASQDVPEDVARDAARYRFQRDNLFRWFPITGEWQWYIDAATVGAKGVAETFERAIDAAILAASKPASEGDKQ